MNPAILKLLGSVSDKAGSVTKGIAGLATGALQSLQAMKLKRKADSTFPDLIDPNQASYLAELNQKRKSIETGADFAEGMRASDATNSATNDAITRNTGGDVSGTIQALLQSQRATNDAKNQIIGQGQAQQFNYDTAYGQKLSEIAARKLQLQLARSSQLRAEWDRKSKLSSANIQAGIADLTSPTKAPEDGAGKGNGLSVLDMLNIMPSIKNKVNVPSSPSADQVNAPTVTPEQPDAMNLGTPITTLPQNMGPLTSLLKK